MARWLFLLGGMLVWAIHFSGAYGIASLGAVAGDAESPAARIAIGLLTLSCLAVDGLLIAMAVRAWVPAMPPGEGELVLFWRSLGGTGAAMSIAAVAWQGLPALLS